MINNNDVFLDYLEDLSELYRSQRIRNNIVYKVDFLNSAFNAILTKDLIKRYRNVLLNTVVYGRDKDKLIKLLSILYTEDEKFRVYLNVRFNVTDTSREDLVDLVNEDLIALYLSGFNKLNISCSKVIGAYKGEMYFVVSDKYKMDYLEAERVSI